MKELPPVIVYGVWLLSLAIQIALAAGIALQVVDLLKSLPMERRRISLPLVWLLLVPAFCVIWIWVVLIQLARSYQPDGPGRKTAVQFALLVAGAFTVMYWLAPTWAWVAALLLFIPFKKRLGPGIGR